MSVFPFGAGRFFFQPGASGVYGTGNYQPVGAATLQDGTINIVDVELKELFGYNRFAVDNKLGKGKINGTFKHCDWDADNLALFLGQSASSGGRALAVDESGTIPATPYAVTVTRSAIWYRDVEVTMVTPGVSSTLAAGQLFTQVASGVSAGSYSVAAGVYTFAAADTGAVVKITYFYTPATGARKVAWSNVPIGTTPNCRGIFRGINGYDQLVVELEHCVPHGWKGASKLDDWTMVDSGFSAFADPDSGVIGTISVCKSTVQI